MTDTATRPTDDPSTAPRSHSWVDVAAEVAAAIEPAAAGHDRDGTFVADSFARARAAGLLRAPIPVELGGGGASHGETCEVLRTLGQACAATAVTLSMHLHLVCTQVWRYHQGLPAEAVLRRVAAEDLVLVSTGAADWVGSSGRAAAVAGGYQVSARKAPSSGAPAGDLLVTSVAWPDAPDGPQVLHLTVPFSAEGVSIEETWDSVGLRGTGSHTVVLDEVFVPEAAVALARPAGRWHPIWDAVLPTAMPLIMAAYLGIADRAVEVATDRARAKAQDPHTAAAVGVMLTHHAVAEDAVAAMVRLAEDLHFAATDERAAATLARKTVAARAVRDAVDAAVEVVGGEGYSRTCILERLQRDAAGAVFHPLPPAKQARFCGRVALGLSPVD